MSSSPRSRTSQTAIFALAVGAAIIGLSLVLVGLGINALDEGRKFVGGLFPPVAVSSQTLNAVDKSSNDAQTKIRAVAGQFQWQFDYLGPDGTTVLYTEYTPLV